MTRQSCLPAVALWLPCCAEAVESSVRPLAGVDLLQWSLALLAVLVALFVFAWTLRRLGQFSRLEPGSFRILAALSLGSRERVVLVQAGAKQLVLGVAPGRVETLCVLEGEEAIRMSGELAPEKPGVQQFKDLLTGRRP